MIGKCGTAFSIYTGARYRLVIYQNGHSQTAKAKTATNLPWLG
jgi:hypothetical protein